MLRVATLGDMLAALFAGITTDNKLITKTNNAVATMYQLLSSGNEYSCNNALPKYSAAIEPMTKPAVQIIEFSTKK